MRLLRRISLPAKDLSALSMANLGNATSEALRYLLCLSQDEFKYVAHGADSRDGCSLLGHRVHVDLVSVRRRRWCPLCLEEAPFWRGVWDLSLMTACPKHGILLVDRCPSCGRGLHWKMAASVTRCPWPHCRADLTKARTSPFPVEGLGGLSAFLALLEAPPDNTGRFDIGDTLRLGFALGAVANGYHRMPRPHVLAMEHPELVPAILDEGWKTISDWPNGFHRLLDRLRTEASRRQGKYGFIKEFGILLTRLVNGWASELPGYDVSDVFKDYAVAQPDLATRAKDIRRRRSAAGLAHRYISLNETAELFSTGREHMRALGRRHGLFFLEPSGSGSASLLQADKVMELYREASSHMTKQAAYQTLRVSKRNLLAMEKAGIISELPPEKRLLPNRPYRREDISAFLTKLESMIIPMRIDKNLCVNLKTLAQQGMTVPDLLVAVLNGDLAPVALDKEAHGVERLLFAPMSVARAFRSEETGMSIHEAARLLGVKEEVAYQWVKGGFLGVVRGTGRLARGKRVRQSDLDVFRAKYVISSEAAIMLGGKSATWASRFLIFQGMTPMSGPDVDGRLRYLFLRSDVETARMSEDMCRKKPSRSRV
jgi:hypothetical protein